MTKIPVPPVCFDQTHWEPCGSDDDPQDRLLATLQVGTLLMHLEAVEIREDLEDPDGWSVPYFPRAEDIETLMGIEDTSFQQTEIAGRQYILYATPYGD